MGDITDSRLIWLDTLRGVAVVLMIIFHFCYDLSYFGWLEADVAGPSAWMPFRYLIITIFVFTMGYSLHLAYSKAIRWKHFFSRQLKLMSVAFLLSALSTLMFPESWVYFGIIHFVWIAGYICLPFVRFWWAALPLALCILVTHWLSIFPFNWPFDSISDWLPAHRSIDFVPPVPWLAIALIGVFLGGLMNLREMQIFVGIKIPAWIIFLGRNSLIIYLLHQPVIFLFLYPISLIT